MTTPIRLAAAMVIFIVGGLVVAAQDTQIRNFRPVTDETLRNPSPDDWINWRRTLDGWGYSPLNQINRENVGQLQLVWSWAMQPGSNQATPLVYDGVMYLPNPNSIVQALDAATGNLIWEYRREYPASGGGSWTSLLPVELTPEIKRPVAGNSILVFALPEARRQ